MPAPKNLFKQALLEGRPQIGFWQALASPTTVEISGDAGFDWLLLDAEHAPNDIPLLVSQLQALKGSPSHPIIRPVEARHGDTIVADFGPYGTVSSYFA